jgi:O-antigen biosynthesis protein WbqP
MTVSSSIEREPDDAIGPRIRPYASKRAFDVVLAVVLLPFAGVALLVLGILVRLTSPGPILFRQERVGRNGRLFVCLKLRTMHQGTASAPSHEIGSSAVTSLGRILRATKLDELPQLWNILCGDMSFVGPRPCLPSQTALIEARRRLRVDALRPGVTGVSQVAGVDMRDAERLARLDVTYLDIMSLRSDVGLILRTALGSGRGDRVAQKS